MRAQRIAAGLAGLLLTLFAALLMALGASDGSGTAVGWLILVAVFLVGVAALVTAVRGAR